MGAQQSSSSGGGSDAIVKTCYYEVLGIERFATDDEIKKAYRKKALELHPDRNYGDVEDATAKFAEVSSAYEILSDPQERAWYDSHRDSILRGDDGQAEEHFEHNVRLTSAEDIVKLIAKFNPSVPFTDAPNGFYGSLRQTFETLAAEEHSACQWDGLELIDYPDFGGVNDDYDGVVKPFYRVWIGFSTKKSFSWRDKYRTSDAPDRTIRRLMDKENKKLREEGVRELNDAVRSLVAFVRKRDPRYLPNSQTEADRQRILRDAAAAQAARSRAANQSKFEARVIPDWAQSQEQSAFEGELSESEQSDIEHIECVVCGKTFKSEKQFEAHEKSKKHIKAVQQIRREMRKENKLLNLDGSVTGSDTSTPLPVYDDMHLPDSKYKYDLEGDDSVELRNTQEVEPLAKVQHANDQAPLDPQHSSDSPPESPSSSEINDEYAPREEVENRLSISIPDASSDLKEAATETTKDFPVHSQPKLGKAKEKRAKKAARQAKEIEGNQEGKCTACNEVFSSKNKLFSHIKDFPEHAKPVSKPAKGGKKKGQ
ncbi:putative DnaJ like protein subfamily C member 21 [Tricladium varicosporioides]|nr:putative DnaJ like protein subfamily C member 21 [Hymenoscyphus varicosporioides]